MLLKQHCVNFMMTHPSKNNSLNNNSHKARIMATKFVPSPTNAVKPVYRRHALQRAPCNNEYFFIKSAESRSIVTVSTICWNHVESTSQINLFIGDTLYFFVANCYSIFKCFNLTHFSTFVFIYIQLVINFCGTNFRRNVQNTPNS